ncbi:hypothetical protein [Kingella sp. (in: b-proteobacteria)]|nr:hypothetical protein [Kingella sp. (in: b-proteobacteria)]MDO4657942.1 hypothetical protein [Kingella sp. (in: b-proteobacteria)]
MWATTGMGNWGSLKTQIAQQWQTAQSCALNRLGAGCCLVGEPPTLHFSG